jgi:hypothetical protein
MKRNASDFQSPRRYPRKAAILTASLLTVFMSCLTIGVALSRAQTAQSPPSNPADKKDWRQVPVKSNAHPDTAKSPSDRQARDDYWTKVFPPERADGRHYAVSCCSYGTSGPEITQIPDSVWAIGTFVDYDVRELKNRVIYTEIHLRIDSIVLPTTAVVPQPGETVDLGISGGAVITPSGEVHRRNSLYSLYEDKYQPGRRYLIQLIGRSGDGQFYTSGEYWDVTNGTAVPVLPWDFIRAKEGRSHIAGLSESDAVKYIQQTLMAK